MFITWPLAGDGTNTVVLVGVGVVSAIQVEIIEVFKLVISSRGMEIAKVISPRKDVLQLYDRRIVCVEKQLNKQYCTEYKLEALETLSEIALAPL